MALGAVQQPGPAGAVPSYAAPGLTDSFKNNGHCLLHVKNAAGAPITVTVDDPRSITPVAATQFNPDVAVTVAAGSEKMIGPFPVGRFNDDVGAVNVTFSSVTSITAAVFQTGT
jgi:hypothetical protein